MWLINYFRELKSWREVRKTYKQNRSEFEKHGLKKDWFGVIYKVINRDPNIRLGTPEDEMLLREELGELNDFLVEQNLMEILAFELIPQEQSDEESFENAYLIKLTPAYNLDKQYVSFKSTFWLFFWTCAFITGLYFLLTLIIL